MALFGCATSARPVTARPPGTVADVVHIRLNEDARAPHCGVSPILAAADTAGALAGLERALRLEANGNDPDT